MLGLLAFLIPQKYVEYIPLYKLGVQEIFLDECGIRDGNTDMLNALAAAVFKGIESGFRYLNSIRLENLP